MTVITLTTDFGLRDGFVGMMRGVIYSIAPQVKIVDISHMVSPQNIHAGGLTLWRAAPFFPSGTIHVFVVDPGVGTDRRPMAARLGNHYFVGPDNGLLTPLLQDAENNTQSMEFVHLKNPKYWLPKISRTFHGRDIFSPVAAHLANGIPLGELGTSFDDPIRMGYSRPDRTENGWMAHIIAIDVFGNLTTDLPVFALQGRNDVLFRVGGTEVRGITDSYGHKHPGDLIVLVDSDEYLEIAVVNGNAAQKLGANVGDSVELVFEEISR